jgi:hypothetical protein
MGGEFSPSRRNLYHANGAGSGNLQTLGNEKPDRPGSDDDCCIAQIDMSRADCVKGNGQRFGQGGGLISHLVGDAQ